MGVLSKRSMFLVGFSGVLALAAGVLVSVSGRLLEQTRDYLMIPPVSEVDLASASTLLPISTEVNYIAGLVNALAVAVLIAAAVSLAVDLARGRVPQPTGAPLAAPAFVQRELLVGLAHSPRPAMAGASAVDLSGVAFCAVIALTTLVVSVFVL